MQALPALRRVTVADDGGDVASRIDARGECLGREPGHVRPLRSAFDALLGAGDEFLERQRIGDDAAGALRLRFCDVEIVGERELGVAGHDRGPRRGDGICRR